MSEYTQCHSAGGQWGSMLILGMTMTLGDPLGTTGASPGIRVKFVASDVVNHLVQTRSITGTNVGNFGKTLHVASMLTAKMYGITPGKFRNHSCNCNERHYNNISHTGHTN